MEILFFYVFRLKNSLFTFEPGVFAGFSCKTGFFFSIFALKKHTFQGIFSEFPGKTGVFLRLIDFSCAIFASFRQNCSFLLGLGLKITVHLLFFFFDFSIKTGALWTLLGGNFRFSPSNQAFFAFFGQNWSRLVNFVLKTQFLLPNSQFLPFLGRISAFESI